jgi:succinate dehydrogenase/fumarate reductase flavoprotein subunit
VQSTIQDLVWEHAGPFRSGSHLQEARTALRGFRDRLDDLAVSRGDVFNLDVQDWYELKAMLASAEAVVVAALNRAESRGAHQRLDAPQAVPAFERNQLLSLANGTLTSRWASVPRSRVQSG